MTMHRSFSEFEIDIARYRRLVREVTDPLAVCLLAVVIEDLEAGFLETGRKQGPSPPSNDMDVRPGER